MGNPRIILYFTLFFIIYMIWAQWQMDYGPKPETVAQTEGQANSDTGLVPQAAPIPGNEVSSMPVIQEAIIPGSQKIKVVTDVLDVEIDTQGGDIRRVVLRDYSVKANEPEVKLVLLTDENINYHVAQSGLVSADKGTAPSHKEIYRSENNIYRLAEGEDLIEVPLYWENDSGVKVKKVFLIFI